jgi:stage II sporulation protein D
MRIRKTYLLLIFLFVFLFQVNASQVNIRILTTQIVNTFIFSPLDGTFSLYGDNKIINCDSTGVYQLSLDGDSITLKTVEKIIGKYSTIKIVGNEASAAFKLKCVFPQTKVHTYDDNLEVSILSDKKQLLLINDVDTEKYIAAVVECESGKNVNIEYYKLQAILCRTYLLAHLNRHIQEGYEICDDVHCQAYLNRATEKNATLAVADTKGLVVVDNDLNLITAAFHSNCGGQTCNSQDVWAVSTSYLKSVKDTFCLNELNAKWQRTISLNEWNNYLQLKHKSIFNDTLKLIGATPFEQANGRPIYFIDKNLKIPLKNIRADFKLKSAYFSIVQVGDSIQFNGRGYGHGVGLCQQGAIRMSNLKYPYKDIIELYYKDVHVVNVSSLNYFKQE